MPGERAEGGQAPAPGNPVQANPVAQAHPQRSLQDRTNESNSTSALHQNTSHVHHSLSQGAASPTGLHTQAVPAPYPMIEDDEDEELDFWGGETRSGPESEEDDDYEDDTDAEESENEEDDDNDDEDIMLFGHR